MRTENSLSKEVRSSDAVVADRDAKQVKFQIVDSVAVMLAMYYRVKDFTLCYYYYYIHLTAFSRTTLVSWHQKGKPFWILLEQEMMGWQWHQLDHMQINCTSLQTDNHASTSPLSFYRLDALPAAQPTASKH